MNANLDLGNVLRALPGNFILLLPDPSYTIVDVSEAMLAATQTRREALIGRPLFEAFPENAESQAAGATAVMRKALETVCRTKAPVAMRLQRYDVRLADGTGFSKKFWLPMLFPVLDGDGQLSAIIDRVQDVTELVERTGALSEGDLPFSASTVQADLLESVAQLEIIDKRIRQSSQLDEASERLDLAADAAELGTWHCPVPLGAVDWNQACKTHFFLPADAKVDMDLFYRLLHPDDREKIRRAFDAALYQRARFDVEYRVIAPDGRSRWLLAKGRASYHADGSPASVNGITLDISDYKRVEEALRESEEEARLARVAAEHASLVKDEFLSTLSHELRTPLNTILGWTQVLQRSSTRLSEKASTALATIERSARQQARLIDDLLDASAIMAGKIHLDLQPVRCNDIIAASVAVSAPMAAARNIRIEVILDEPGMAIEADPTRLQQILCRLLSNAIKFSSNDGTVLVRQIATNDKVVITVTDHGQGIAPAFLPSLFARFSQADGSITRTHMGLGLGLSIVKSLIELHGGKVSAASQGVAQGAVFTLELPALVADDLTPTTGAVVGPGHPVERPDLNVAWHANIVVVDDEPDAGAVMREILESAGATVRLASSATEALQLIRESRPDLLISDIGMPQIDGYQLLRLLRKDEPRDQPPVPAIALTAFARPEDKQRAIEAGYLIHLAKPVESADLITAAKLAVRRPNRQVDTGAG